MTISCAELLGHGWAGWRGRWQSDRVLVHRGSEWVVEEKGCEAERWLDLSSALDSLWPQRSIRDRLPWAVGWIGYEEAADLAGDLPVGRGGSAEPTGRFLIEPEPAPAAKRPGVANKPLESRASWSLDGGKFRDGVVSIRQRIAAGDVYQVNLCRRLTVEGSNAPLGAFAAEAARGGEPDYLARFHFGEGELLCASMELLLRRSGEMLETAPIKGTRPRGETPDNDRRLKSELTTDPKEKAELAMVIDLARNDLGKVSKVGTVDVIDPGSVRSYATVHHLVGRVTGRARSGLNWWELLAAVAPGGSVTGCPKHAAMELIQELEPVRRGPFTGAFGVVGGDGDLKFALPIRTAWKVGSKLEFAAGCGVVWQSDPEREEEECRLKVARWLELVGRAG